MKTKTLATALLVATSVSAYAVGPGPLGAIDNTPIAISNIVPMGIFQDVYSFTLVDPGTLSGYAVANNFDGYNILGLTVTLQDSSFAVVGSNSTPDTGFSFGGLASGSYALNVLGYANGSTGGYCAGGFIAETTPTVVPEPQAYALMLVGLGIVGFAVRRHVVPERPLHRRTGRLRMPFFVRVAQRPGA
jgi:hypothetical protein